MARPALPASVTIEDAGGGNAITITAHNLGDDTSLEPADQTKTVLAGYSRPVGAPYDLTVTGFTSDYDDLKDRMVANTRLDVTFNYDDGGSRKAKRVGFQVVELLPAQAGDLDGWTLTGRVEAANVAGALDIAPAFGA